MRNLPLLLPAGDCGDGVVPVPGGWQLHGNPGPDAPIHRQGARGDLGVEREEEVGNAVVIRVGFGIAVHRVAGAPVGVLDAEVAAA